MTIDFSDALSFAVTITREAGELALKLRTDDALDTRMKNGAELVTAADLAIDQLIQDAIAQRFPGHRVVSEEAVTDLAAVADGSVWIMDPIDGTANYASGGPYFGIALALAIEGEVKVGVVHAPQLRETFTAIKGAGARLNGRAISVGPGNPLAHAVISTGFPHIRGDIAPLVTRVERLLANCRDIRRGSSPVIDICWVGCGRLDAHTETLFAWDVAAAGLVATEAGALRGNLGFVPANVPVDLAGEQVIFAHPRIYDELFKLLAAA
ncbi:inositol monophosphatase family protein [Micromonospora sp. NPDC051196]|uniref:inositol monophosphatase family protein n=1 Tax=Micromonospora sp. NPDC051196 TaxID=3155281 RepID=UPI0034174CCE